MVEACVGLGSNLGQPARQVAAALARLADWPGVSRLRASRLYRSAPWGDVDQPDYVNAVAVFGYAGDAATLLDGLLAIEREAGRVRDGRRWGPRTLDLDLLLYGDQQIDLPRLKVPHPYLSQRNFVLYPLAAIAPDLVLPCGTSLTRLCELCPRGDLVPLATA